VKRRGCGKQRASLKQRLPPPKVSAVHWTIATKSHSACVRCPLLRQDPNQKARLIEIQDNLKGRLAEAKQRMWLGEVEGLNIGLAGAEQKLAAMASALPPQNGANARDR
jgi:hypothetical protein